MSKDRPRRIRREAVTPPHPEAVMPIGAGSQEGTWRRECGSLFYVAQVRGGGERKHHSYEEKAGAPPRPDCPLASLPPLILA